MPELPGGTVTFLFTDIEGSTRLLDELGAEGYAEELAAHRRILRAAFDRHGGVEVDTQGDAFFVAFPTAPGALAAAAEAQAALNLPVRMGIHTGTPLVAEGDYVGIDVHRAARIAAAGHGGQVLVSAATAQLVDGGELRDLGEHRLKDLGRPLRLYQLGGREFAPLRSLNQTNLPAQPSPLVGRERELEDLLALVPASRAVTLTGPGGSGKTRLALQVSAELVERFAGGVYFCSLAAVTDPELVLPTIGQTIGSSNDVAEHVGDRELLFLLDNLEQVVQAAPVLAELLARCPNLRLLSTSRALLRIAGERDYPVDPMPEDDAVELFRERAVTVEPVEAVREICRRLDGLPLAVELAAARTRLLPPDALLERLDRALPLLTGGRRDAPERQRTLRATIAWSYELLEPEERSLFRRLAVFAGSFTVEAAEQVCEADLELLESLLEKSLLRRWYSGRLGILDTIREYAAEQLAGCGEEGALRRSHAEFFLDLAEEAGLYVEAIAKGGGLSRGYATLIPERENLRAALEYLVGAGEFELAMRLAVALEQFWVTNAPAEGRRWLGEILERGADVPPELRVRALRALGGASHSVGEHVEGGRIGEAALAEYERLGDKWGIAHMKLRHAVELTRRGDLAGARTFCEESLAADSGPLNEAQITVALAVIEEREGRVEEAIELYDRGAQLAGEIDFLWWQSNALLGGADAALQLGRPEDAEPRLREALRLTLQMNERQGTVYALSHLAGSAALRGDAAGAGRLWGVCEAESERHPIGHWETDRDELEQILRPLAGPEFEQGRAEGRALSLAAAVDSVLGDQT